MAQSRQKSNDLRNDSYSKHLVSVNAKSFSNRNIIEDFSFNDTEYRHAKFMNKAFGSKKFIKAFLRLVLPSLFWGLLTALVPILFNTMINGVYVGSSVGNMMYLSVNYTAYIFSPINSLVISFVFAAFPAVGNYIGQHNKAKMQEVIRWAVYISVFFCTLGLILEEVFAYDIAYALVWNWGGGTLSGSTLVQNNYAIILIKWFAASSFFYLWLWIYVPSFSSMKSVRVLYYSALVGFIYFIIAYPSYLHATYINITGSADADQQATLYGTMNGIGGIYFGYFIIQPLFLAIYSYFPREFKVFEAHCYNFFIRIWNAINKNAKESEITRIKKTQKFAKPIELHSVLKEDYTGYERDLLIFQTGFKATFKTLKTVIDLAWVILLDQVIYAVLSLILLVYSKSFGGTWINGFNGIYTNNGHYTAHEKTKMAKEYYDIILANTTLISGYIYSVYNGFSLLPQYFVAYYIGKQDRQTAYHNSTILTHWGLLFGFILGLVIIIYGSFINELIYHADSASIKYTFNYKETVDGVKKVVPVELGTYGDVWRDAFYIQLLYAVSIIFDTAVAMIYYILAAGGSKLIVFADSLIDVFNDALLLALFYTHYDNFFVYYIAVRSHTFLKCIIGMIIIYTRGALYGVDNTHGGKTWFKQKFVTPKFDDSRIVIN